MNETLKVIEKRFSCRSFTNKIPKCEDIDAIALAGIQAPSGKNRQNWQVIVVKNKELMDNLEQEAMKILSQINIRMYDKIMSLGGKMFYNAPYLIIIAIKETEPKGAELIDCGILAQNMSLAATSLGIANLHCGLVAFAFAGDKKEEFKARLKFADGYEIGMGILLGYAKENTTPHLPNLEKIVYID